jgi:TonB family protein
MNRLQKKCLIASVATHGLLLAILLIGPAFLSREDRAQPARILTMISSRVVDDALSSDAASASRASQPPPAPAAPPAISPPAPAPPAPPTPPAPSHRIPQPEVAPQPLEIPQPSKEGTEFKRVTPPTTAPTKDFVPVSHAPIQAKPKVKPADSNATDPNAAEVEAQRILAQRLKNRIGKFSSTLAGENSVQIGPVGDGGPAVSNYRDIVYSIYTAAWQPPSSLTDELATVTARVTIARDGRVTSHEITKPSGNAAMDRSIENTLSSVTFVEPFPVGAKDLERSYSIKFDISAKRSLE